MDDLERLRVEYDNGEGFAQTQAGDDPMGVFASWMRDARENSSCVEPNAMALATSTPSGEPSCRMVLLKGFDPQHASFHWYTNLESRKSIEVASGARRAALTWWWPGDVGRQVRVAGSVELLSREQVVAYDAQRPFGARVGARISRQSRPISTRAQIDERYAAALEQEIESVPASWGGHSLFADEIEFWQGRAGRTHDRIMFFLLDQADQHVAPSSYEPFDDDAVAAYGSIVTDTYGRRWRRVRLQP
jgi:pyridoxamine 5'-phosphate oxidase